ncbi:protein FAR1-RELATED SEQUENCE 5 [Spinacia oleracea]|uniref:Protein FAR1-RELATED SEQUENCE 5 n=1 Tax=Spinacia oleracea TaxID=3562 RepID=A0ABM3QPZ1_SPIOL|nr:protein FAR1-RELATED SEQUENCE 5-like [Spinacia oleracea]
MARDIYMSTTLMNYYAPLFFLEVSSVEPVKDFVRKLSSSCCDKALEKLNDPDTECKSMVFEFGPLILVDAGKFIQNVDLCSTFDAWSRYNAGKQQESVEGRIKVVIYLKYSDVNLYKLSLKQSVFRYKHAYVLYARAMEGLDLNETVTIEDCIEDTGATDKNSNPPTEGMCFLTGQEFFDFCNMYAFKEGFEMFMKSNTLKQEYKAIGVNRKGVGELEPKPHMMEFIRLKCKKGGTNVGSNVTGCKMFIYGKNKDDKFTILKCELKHNHALNPDCSRMMVNYRNIDSTTFKRAMINDMGGVSITKNYGTQLIEKGGFDNIAFNQRDLRNAISVERRKSRFKDSDAAGLDQYFKAQRELNSEFYCSIQKDDDGVFTNAFWSDARSRGTCKYFGDVITFDTTFSCNRFRMPFAPFIGVNHHGKSIIFAAALISHEDAPTFVWVFEELMKCMGKAPTGILTDQDRAIGKAIKQVFPGVPHRLCLWHMLQNATKALGSRKDWLKIDTLIRTAIHDLLDPDEFDEAWCHVMEEYGLTGPGWMKDAYELRCQWAPAYNRGKFWAGMSSRQRSEGMNRFFKTHVNLECGLVLFIKNYEWCMRIKAEEEKQDNYDSIDKIPRLEPGKSVLVEYVLVKSYTNEKFAEVVA